MSLPTRPGVPTVVYDRLRERATKGPDTVALIKRIAAGMRE